MAIFVPAVRARFISSVFAVAVVLSAVAFPSLAQAQQHNEATDAPRIQTLAIVNGSSVTRKEVADECMRRFGNEVLESLINKMLVFEECQRPVSYTHLTLPTTPYV